MARQRMRLLLRSYDHRLLDDAVRQIVAAVRRTGSKIKGPVPLPNKVSRFTVLRSPHIDKESREQFELVVHKRLIDIVMPSEQTMNALMRLNIAAGVDVEVR